MIGKIKGLITLILRASQTLIWQKMRVIGTYTKYKANQTFVWQMMRVIETYNTNSKASQTLVWQMMPVKETYVPIHYTKDQSNP